MTLFMIETDTVESGATSIDSLTTSLTDLSSKVSGYDSSCSDSEIASAFKNATSCISNNISACATKFSNTSGYINSVVASHTTLQNGLKFQSSKEKAAAEKASKSGSGSYSGSYSGGGYMGGGSTGGGSTGGGHSSTSYTTPTKTTAVEPAKPVEIKEKVKGIDHKKVVVDSLSELGKKLFKHEDLVYNAAGYATIGGMFIIACSKAYGEVGDELEFTLSDGQKFKCIIGEINDNTDGKIQFFINDKWKENGEENFQNEIGNYITKIENKGVNAKYTVGVKVASAIDWATATAADNSHGYSQQTRWGNPNYDCSSFVISSYEAAGINVKESGATYTGNMRQAFVRAGFEWIPGTPDVNTLQPGDVVLNEGKHTEMYIGNGKLIGAHGNSDGQDGDSSGNEISITNYSNKSWDGVLRYVGKNTAEASNDPVTVPTAPRVTITNNTAVTNNSQNNSDSNANSDNDNNDNSQDNDNNKEDSSSNNESSEGVAV